MLKTTKNISVSGRITVDDGGSGTEVMVASANISESGSISFSKYVRDKDLYESHKEEVDADYEEFEEYVYSL